jgi:YVTN family beta-propeller protein
MSANGVRIAAVIAVVLTMTVGCATDGPQRSDARDSSLSSSLAPPAPPVQAPALPGAQAISDNDRVYTADQVSNTVSVIDPKTMTMLGTIALGQPRLAPDADVLGAMYDGEIDVHGLGFSRDGRWLDVIDVTSNAVHVIDTGTNKVVSTVYVGRAPHEGFFSPDGNVAGRLVSGGPLPGLVAGHRYPSGQRNKLQPGLCEANRKASLQAEE